MTASGLSAPTSVEKGIYCSSCHQHPLLHAKDCPNKQSGLQKAGDPDWLLGKQMFDLHVGGDEACEHEFAPWESSSGTATVVDSGESVILAWLQFKSACKRCPATVGRRMEAKLQDDAGKPRCRRYTDEPCNEKCCRICKGTAVCTALHCGVCDA